MEDLTVIQDILIILACILVLAILIVVVVLFVAVNYSIKAEGQDSDIRVKAVASCIFGAVRAVALYGDGDLKYKISAFGITIKKGKFGDKKSKKDKGKRKKIKTKKEKKKFSLFMKESEKLPEKPPEPVVHTPDVSRETVVKMLEEQKAKEQKKILAFNIPKLNSLKGGKSSKSKKPKKTFKEKFNEFWAKVQKFVNKAKDYKDKASKIKRALDTKTGQRAIKYIKVELLKLFKAIKPDSIKGYVKYGSGDPSNTAKIYGIAAQASYLITKDQLVVEPDFENKIIDLNVTVKGKIFLYEILIIVVQTIANKDVSRIWKEIRRIANG